MSIEVVECQEGRFSVMSNDAIADRIKECGWWERHFSTVCQLIKSGSVAIDGGANFGYNSVIMARRAGPKGRVLCFEPQPLMFQRLEENFPLNGLENGELRMQALWDVSGPLKISGSSGDAKGLINYGAARVGHGFDCEGVTIDSLRLKRLEFVKLDIEGHEGKAIRGGLGTIKRFKPVLHVEYDKNLENCSTECLDLLKTLGYRIFVIKCDYPSDHLCMPPGDDRHESLGLNLEEV